MMQQRRNLGMAVSRTVIVSLAILVMLISSGVAQAVIYVFPTAMPPGCSGTAGNYSCGALSLAYGDSVSIASPKPAKITINGTLNTNTATINAPGSANDLSIVVTGALTTGYQAVLNANVTAASIDVSGGGSSVTYGGSVSVTSGDLVLKDKAQVGGSISSTSGSITIGQDSTVAGDVASSAGGGVSVGYRSTVGGAVTTSGVVTLGQESQVSGAITGASGKVNVGYGAKVMGPITTSSGAISFAQNSVASGCVTSTGSASIRLDYQASVAGVCCGASCGNSCVINASTFPMPAACVPPLNLAKGASATDVALLSYFSYTLTASNSSPVALNNVVVTDVIPTGLNYVASATTLGASTVSGQTLSWTLPTLPANTSAQLTLVVQAAQKGTFTNTITALGALPASAPSVSVGASPDAYVHYRMDEPAGSWKGTAGEVKDSGSKTLNGSRLPRSASGINTVAPNPAIPSPPVVGSFCNAASFDGSGAVETPSNTYFSFKNVLSASAWIYPTGAPSSDVYAILSNDVNYEFHLDTGRHLYWWWEDAWGNEHTLTSSATIPLNTWTHVAITMDATSSKRRERIYINGSLDNSSANWSGTLRNNSCPFYIGGDIGTDRKCTLKPERNFHGMIDEVRIYNYELTASQVRADMTFGRQCDGAIDHIRIEHDGLASVCAPETVTIKACVDAGCTTLYTGNVTVNLSPTGWIGGDSFSFSGGVTSRQLSHTTSGNVTLGTTDVLPVPANATRCFKGSGESCVMNFAASSCLFDAVEPGANPQTHLYTKLAGTAFSVDLLALTSSGAVNPKYTGVVTVDLVDASASACPTGSGLAAATSVSYVASTDAGRKTVSFAYPNAARNVKVRAKVGSGTPACSTDSFAIRPKQFTVTSPDMANAGLTGIPKATAGTAFSLTAASEVSSGYDGTPLLDAAKVNDHNGVPIASGALSGSFGPGTGASATGSGFKYLDVGNIRLAADAVVDSGFSSVDQTTDCVVDSTSNTLSGGKYGCNIGSVASTNFGRWYPSHYSFSGALTPGCATGTFTYMDQDALGLTLTLKAHATSGAVASASDPVVSRYTAGYPNLASVTLAGDNGGVVVGVSRLSSPAFPTMPDKLKWLSGVWSINETYALSKLAAVDGPFDQFKLVASLADPDGSPLIGASKDKETNTTRIRNGRARLSNAYGSEMLDLPVPFRTEYWNGTGWVLNSADSCTGDTSLGSDNAVTVSLASVPAALTCIQDNGNPGLSGSGCAVAAVSAKRYREGATPAMAPPFAGDFNLWLRAPGVGGRGNATVTATVPPWLGLVAPARVWFGIYKSPLIYRREVYQ